MNSDRATRRSAELTAAPVDSIAFHAAFNPDRLALLDLASGRRWSYAELDLAVARYAGAIRKCWKVGDGDRVAMLAGNRAELLIVHFACARIGAIYVPLNWRLAAAEIAAVLDDLEPALLLGDGELDRMGLRGVSLDDLAARAADETPFVAGHLDPDRVSLILYTSGTSGRPKGAMLSERNLAQLGLNSSLFQRVDRDSRYLIDSPMFHIIGIASSVRPPLMWGGAVIVSERFEPQRTLRRIEDPALAVTHYFCVPQMAAMLRNQPDYDASAFRRLTALFSGGAPLPAAELAAWLDDGIPVVSAYGLSEAGSVFMMPVDLAAIRGHPQAVGTGTPGIRARVVDADSVDCPDGVPGEILLKGDNVFKGYWRSPEQTQAAFTSDGWLRTGDVAVVRDGYYEIVDRKKDMFISGGENIYPAEIENAVSDYPGIVEVAVVGVPDARWGEVGHMVIVGEDVDPAAVLDALAARIARYKLPRHVSFCAALPRTGSGKVMKDMLRAWLASGAEQRP